MLDRVHPFNSEVVVSLTISMRLNKSGMFDALLAVVIDT
ncbi:hypothetical protein SPONN_701 [uncultured Candidatus Thioglobus sp.]|nr:hypothetical protein SPONN_701 [uncultured Candidatus Thioglobus sp.]